MKQTKPTIPEVATNKLANLYAGLQCTVGKMVHIQKEYGDVTPHVADDVAVHVAVHVAFFGGCGEERSRHKSM